MSTEEKKILLGALLGWYIMEGLTEWPVDPTWSRDIPFWQDLPAHIVGGHRAMPAVAESAALPQKATIPATEKPTLQQLYQEMSTYTACSLAQNAQNMVFSDGNPTSHIVIVGEAPGAEEDRQGKPFVGMSGKLLDNMLSSIGLHRDNVYIMNIVPWRPPFNRQPTAQEIALCLPFVHRHLAIVQPKVLMLMGAVACRALLKSTESMAALQRGQHSYVHTQPGDSIPAWVFYHPAYLLRSPGQKRQSWRQLITLRRFLTQNRLYTPSEGRVA